jgi:hypothetical protein
MSKERELLFTIVEQWGNAACNKEELLKVFVKDRAIGFVKFMNRSQYLADSNNEDMYWDDMGNQYTQDMLYQIFSGLQAAEIKSNLPVKMVGEYNDLQRLVWNNSINAALHKAKLFIGDLTVRQKGAILIDLEKLILKK